MLSQASDQQRLLSAARQRELLDAFGGHAAACVSVATCVSEWRANRDALAALQMTPEEIDPPDWYPVRRILSELLAPRAARSYPNPCARFAHPASVRPVCAPAVQSRAG